MTEQIDWRTKHATITSGFCLRRSEVLRSLRHYLQAQSQEYHTVNRLEERSVERGSFARRYSLKGRERAISSVRRTFKLFLRDGMDHIIMCFSEHIDTLLNCTELI